jgi:Flp pilus assembly protein TadG
MAIGHDFREEVDTAMSLALKQRRTRGESGSAILETALSIMILLTFLFGVMETGLALYSYHFISEAAREGTRFAIVRGSSLGANCTAPGPPTCTARPVDVQNYVLNLGFPGIDPANMTVTPVWSPYTSGSPCPASPSPCNSPGNLVTVTVQYNFPLTVPFVPAHTYSLTSSSAMIISQ